jgi:hypothetical protein
MSKSDSLPKIEIHKELNPKLWDGQDLEPKVQVALLRIAREFYEFLDFDAPLEDVQITGSQANYNYSPYSDIDLHLIVPFEGVSCDQPVEDMFDAKRKLWKSQHDISIHGIPVEVYVEDKATPVNGSSYSLLKNKWLDKPDIPHVHWDTEEIARETLVWLEHIRGAMGTQDLDRLHKVKSDLGHYRKHSLGQAGEFSTGNLVYKNLRNLGVVGLLMKAILKLEDRDLSI